VAVDAADIPETFFVFVNLLNPMTAHNARLVGYLIEGRLDRVGGPIGTGTQPSS
jgi:hypothetical protein